MAKINVQGRRMVQEDKIAKIGEGGGEYTAGNGINITNDEISVDETVVQGKLTAGSGISIENDVISATASGASFTDWVDMTNKSSVTADEYNAILNGEKRIKYDNQIYEVSWIITEPDWAGFTGMRLESSAPGMIGVSGTGIGKVNAVIWAPGTAHEYEFERNEDVLIKGNTSETPSYTLTDIRIGDNVYSVGGTTVSGTNDGTNWTSLTVGSDTYGIPSGGSTPSNMVTTDTDQTISANKTFGSNKTINMNDAVKLSEYGLFNATGAARSTGFQLGTWDRCKGIVSFNRVGSSTDNPDYPVTSTNDRYNFNIHLNSGGISSTVNTFIFDPSAFYYTKSSSGYGASGANLGTSAHLFKNLYLSGNITDGTNTVSVSNLKTVSGTNDGTNWTALTIGSDTYNIPSGGGSGSTKYTHNITFSLYDNAQSKYVVDGANITLVSSSSSQLGTYGEFSRLIYANNTTSMAVSGAYDDGTDKGIILSVSGRSSGNSIMFRIYKLDGTESFVTFTGQYAFTLNEDSVL